MKFKNPLIVYINIFGDTNNPSSVLQFENETDQNSSFYTDKVREIIKEAITKTFQNYGLLYPGRRFRVEIWSVGLIRKKIKYTYERVY